MSSGAIIAANIRHVTEDPVLARRYATEVFTSDNGNKAIGDDTSSIGYGTGFELTRLDGGAFNLDALVFALLRGSGFGDVRVNVDPYGPNQDLTYIATDGHAYGGPTINNVRSLFFDAYTSDDKVGISSITVTDIPGTAIAGAVPEPATWAMMIGGFGVVGGAMRRRGKAKTAVSFA